METSYATSIDKDSDGVLVAAAKCGDTQAFEELVFRHEQRVLAVAQRITNNREDAEDVAQESRRHSLTRVPVPKSPAGDANARNS